MSLLNAAKDVVAFHYATKSPVVLTPTTMAPDRVRLRKRLRDEEAVTELDEAFEEDDPIKLLDAIVDSIYILLGTAAEAGITPKMVDEAWQEVHSSNMSKCDPVTGLAIHREDGKILKPASYHPPDLIKVFENGHVRYSKLQQGLDTYLEETDKAELAKDMEAVGCSSIEEFRKHLEIATSKETL